MNESTRTAGMTLIELIVVVAVTGIIVAILAQVVKNAVHFEAVLARSSTREEMRFLFRSSLDCGGLASRSDVDSDHDGFLEKVPLSGMRDLTIATAAGGATAIRWPGKPAFVLRVQMIGKELQVFYRFVEDNTSQAWRRLFLVPVNCSV